MSLDFQALLKAERNKAKKTRKKHTSKPLLEKRNKLDIESELLLKCPASKIFYLNSFLSEEEEIKILEKITSDQKKWVSLTNRRLKNLGGVPHFDGMISEDLPDYCCAVSDALNQLGFEMDYNQVLLNEYCNGKGIDLHQDGQLYHSMACIVSLESPALLEFCEKKTDWNQTLAANVKHDTMMQQNPEKNNMKHFTCLLQPRSLLVFCCDAYEVWYHGIRDAKEDVIDENCINCKEAGLQCGQIIPRGGRRISLTIRSCKKVANRTYSVSEEEEIKRREMWWIDSINEKY